MLNAILPSNDQQLDRAFQLVADAGARRVGVLGLAFKAGTDDLRESPMVEVVERLIGKGVLVGGGPYQPSIKAYAEEVGVAGLCTFTGRVSDDDLCRVLSSADVGVDPDPKNDWSDKSTMNKIMEYMFFSLPIVAYDLTEHRVSAGSAALFADANRERALAGCISELLDDPARRQRMGRAGRKRVQADLAWEHSAPVLLAAYERLWQTPGGAYAIALEQRSADRSAASRTSP